MKLDELVGKIPIKVFQNEGDEIHLIMDDGNHYKLYHYQECCETVYIEDIAGDLQSLVGTPLTMAEKASNHNDPLEEGRWYRSESCTWTYYKFASLNGYVTIRWYGESNGFYSESVDFVRVN